MPAKMAILASRPQFGLPEAKVAVRTLLQSCGKAVKRGYSRKFGSHLRNPRLGDGKKTSRDGQHPCQQVDARNGHSGAQSRDKAACF